MISFECEHCGKALTGQDDFAGRDGWCHVCLNMIIVPEGGVTKSVKDLSVLERNERLYRLFQYAAQRADDFKAKYRLQQKALEEATSAPDSADPATQARLCVLEAEAEKANEYATAAREKLRAARIGIAQYARVEEELRTALSEQDDELERAARAFDSEADQRAAAERESGALRHERDAAMEREDSANEELLDARESLDAAAAEREALRKQCAETEAALADSEQARAEVRDANAALESDLDAVRTSAQALANQLTAPNEERDNLRKEVETTAAMAEEAKAALEAQKKKIAQLRESVEVERCMREGVESELRATRERVESVEHEAHRERDAERDKRRTDEEEAANIASELKEARDLLEVLQKDLESVVLEPGAAADALGIAADGTELIALSPAEDEEPAPGSANLEHEERRKDMMSTLMDFLERE